MQHPLKSSVFAINMTCGWITPIAFHLYLIVELGINALTGVTLPFVHKAK